jgi:hypothetical protein
MKNISILLSVLFLSLSTKGQCEDAKPDRYLVDDKNKHDNNDGHQDDDNRRNRNDDNRHHDHDNEGERHDDDEDTHWYNRGW